MAAKKKRVTVVLPEDVLDSAMRITGKGITETLLEGLRAIERRRDLSALRKLRGRVRFELELEPVGR
jgi:hypothetical protein